VPPPYNGSIFTHDRKFFDEILLPWTDAAIEYYTNRFTKRDANGKMFMEGMGCAETYQGVTNPCTEIGCLKYLTEKTEKPVSILKVEYDTDLEPIVKVTPSLGSLTAGKSGTTIDLGQSQTFDRLEFTIDNPGHRRGEGKDFELQAQQADGSWKTVHSGKIYGLIYAKRFARVSARHVRLNISTPVSQFDLFPPGK
jgi:hypothetical protein